MAKQATRRATRKRSTPAVVYFGSAAVQRPNADATLPAKFARILKKLDLKHLCQGARVPIKMHLGGGLGYTTIHPVFVRALVRALQDAGGKPFVVDAHFGTIASAAERGYTAEALGCPIVAAGGPYDSHLVPRKVRHRRLQEMRVFGAIWDAPCLINFAHVKGHGDCGHAGACKNIAMGCVTDATVRLSPSMSVSLSNTSITLFVLSSLTVALSSLATGESFKLVTVTDTVAVSVPPFPSDTV